MEEEEFSRVIAEDIAEDEFLEMCDEREGWPYVTAFCAGSGQCRGMFLLEGTVTEYSCKGMNGPGTRWCWR